MWSISETIEKGNVFVTASPSLWIDEHILYWPPPGEQIDRSTISTPGPDWIPHMCRVLKDKIGKINFFLSDNSSCADSALFQSNFLCDSSRADFDNFRK